MSIKDKLPAGTLLGFGTAPLGNMFRDIPEAEAAATVDAAWDHGIRYFDTAPFYGAGLSEIRLGRALARRNRDDYVLSTKVGRLILDEVEDASTRDLGEKGGQVQQQQAPAEHEVRRAEEMQRQRHRQPRDDAGDHQRVHQRAQRGAQDERRDLHARMLRRARGSCNASGAGRDFRQVGR